MKAERLQVNARLAVEIHGAVQGVGFRPFVYRLATELALAGWVINDTQGVFIEVEGQRAVLEDFLARLPAERPPRALIQSLDACWLEPAGYTQFEIRHSTNHGSKTVLVLPDIATCSECMAEVLDPANRRYRYPFTNCTNCGPRFTIIEALPYDRPNTTMRRFTLCPACSGEYQNPLDRRFHAQPNACPVCGPSLALYRRADVVEGALLNPVQGAGEEVFTTEMAEGRGRTRRFDIGIGRGATGDGLSARGTVGGKWPAVVGTNSDQGGARWALAAERDDALRAAAAAIKAGQIVALKGLGGFHLVADARNSSALRRLRAGKPRREKPFALMAQDLAQARTLCEIPDATVELLQSPEAPIVLLRRLPGAPVAVEVAPDNPYLGVMLPYTPLHHLLLAELPGPVVATSGNLTDEPICTDEWEALGRLGDLADLFLLHDRPIARHIDDSVTMVMAGAPRLLRRARGYAPLPVLLKHEVPTILAVGAHLKNTVALSIGRQAFISQHIGDLETPEALGAFERVIADFLRLYEAQPAAIAHDLHPDYLSTKWAMDRASSGESPQEGPRLIPVQHHHAHLAACLAENGWEGRALGVTWDGTGYGTDGTLWGGEFLLGDAADYTRVAHLRPFRLPGGEAAIKEPGRLALALLWELYGEEALARVDLPSMAAFRSVDRGLFGQMLRRGTNAPVTTGAGRLFDAIAALIGLRQQVTYEGQAAMQLEFVADPAVRDAYPLSLHAGGGSLVLDWAPLVEAVLEDLRRGISAGVMAARFHNALVKGMVKVAQTVGEPVVALSGGCFQNRWLTERTTERLGAAGFQVLLHRQVPPNDGGISLGQMAVAAARMNRGL
jgi:hydrogenase maturation protein HypF